MLQRYKVISLTVAAVFICYIDRVVISLAIIPMSEGMGWSETQRGFILSSFYIGYILTQIIGGLLSDRMGAKIVLLGSSWTENTKQRLLKYAHRYVCPKCKNHFAPNIRALLRGRNNLKKQNDHLDRKYSDCLA